VFDVSLSFLLLLLSPLLLWFWKPIGGLFKNAWLVLLGKKTWVGYCAGDPQLRNLPKLRPGVLSPLDALPLAPTSPHTFHRVNLFYAKDYQTARDWDILWKGLWKLGR
jgi:hypothetical protein